MSVWGEFMAITEITSPNNSKANSKTVRKVALGGRCDVHIQKGGGK